MHINASTALTVTTVHSFTFYSECTVSAFLFVVALGHLAGAAEVLRD